LVDICKLLIPPLPSAPYPYIAKEKPHLFVLPEYVNENETLTSIN